MHPNLVFLLAFIALALPSSLPAQQCTIIRTPQWMITPQGPFVQAESEALRLRFAYDARGAEGWFKGGGGCDGSIVELYHKPTSATRNLVPRNGPWGGKKDALDFWELEPAAQDGADHNAPQFSSAADGVLLSHTVRQSAGRLISTCDIQLQTFRIRRTHIIYPWGDITMHARIEHIAPCRWNYLGHRFDFGVKPYQILNGKTTYDWGGLYQTDGEYYYAFSDLYGPDGKYANAEPFIYKEQIVDNLNKNTAVSMYNRQDPYSGFMIEDKNGNDPDIVVMNGDKATWFSPFDRIARKIGGVNYVETGIYTPFYAKAKHTEASCCWFYATIPRNPIIYNAPLLWPADLGVWEESFHILLRQDLDAEDYLPLWRYRVRGLEEHRPRQVEGARVELNNVDRLYHVIADPGAKAIRFTWSGGELPADIEPRTAFLLEGVGPIAGVKIDGEAPPKVDIYSGEEEKTALLVLRGPRPGGPITVSLQLK